jgi:hypothetical protein
MRYLYTFFIAIVVGLCLVTFSVYSADIETVEKLAKECVRGKKRSCQKLNKIAMKDIDRSVREAAVEKLTDQATLAEVAKTDAFQSICRAAVEKLTDQDALVEVAKADTFESTRLTAVEKLTDQAALAEVVKLGTNDYIRCHAVEKLTDQKVLAEIIKNIDEDSSVRQAAIRNITDQALLAEVARNDKDNYARQLAVENLTDQTVLADIARNEEEWEVCEAALKRLKDQAELANVVLAAKKPSVRMTAIRKLENQDLFIDVVRNDKDSAVRCEAVKKLNNQAMLAEVAKNDVDKEVRRAAIKKLTDPTLLADIARTDEDSYVCVAALDNPNLTDQTAIANIAKNAVSYSTRRSALYELKNQEILLSISKDKGQPLNLRLNAVSLLKDPYRFNIDEDKITPVLFELRQEAIGQKNKQVYRDVIDMLTTEALIEMRERAPKTVIQGRVLHRESKEPVTNMPTFLGEMQKNGEKFTLYSDLMTITDQKGNFTLKNVPNGIYTIIYSLSDVPILPSAIFILEPKTFNTSLDYGNFDAYGKLKEGRSGIYSTELDINLLYEVRDSQIVEYDVYGTETMELVFELY